MTGTRAEGDRVHFDRLADAIGTSWWGNRTAAGARRQERRAVLAAAWLGLGAATRALELGCGAGDFTQRLLPAGARLVAVDLSPRILQVAQARLGPSGVQFEVASVEALPFRDGAFDVILGNAVLHHLDLTASLPEIRRVLRPGGRIFFAEPNMLNPQVWIERHVRLVGRWLQNSPRETAFYRWQLAAALRRAGFTSVVVAPFDFLHPAVPRRLVPVVDPIGLWLERLPLVREFAGSLRVAAARPG